MKITVITLFPQMVSSFFEESIVRRAIEKELVEIEVVNLRDFAKDNHKTVDDKPYGGGAGMVLMAKPIVDAIRNTKSEIRSSKQNQKSKSKIQNNQQSTINNKTKVVLTSPRGRVYNQSFAQEYAKLDHLIIIAGHYEGVDERVTNYIDEEVSIGDFVMTGGEIAAAAIVDSVVRLVPGVLKKEEATGEESFFEVSVEKLIAAVGEHEVLLRLKKRNVSHVRLLEYPHYTRPEEYDGLHVPNVLLSGNHAEIEKWRLCQAFALTIARRPDLFG